MDPRDPHPWDDPAQAPRNFDRALEQPALGINPADSQDFYDYQNRLALQNQMMHDQMRRSAGGATDTEYEGGRAYTPSVRQERTSVDDQLAALLANLTGDGRPKLSVDIVLNAFYGFLDKRKYRLDDADFDALAKFVRMATRREPSMRGRFESSLDLFRKHVRNSTATLRQAEGATAVAREKPCTLERGDPGVPRPTPHGPPLSWLPSIRKADQAALRGYETEVKNAQFHARVSMPLEISNLEGKETRARSDNDSEVDRLTRLERVLRMAYESE